MSGLFEGRWDRKEIKAIKEAKEIKEIKEAKEIKAIRDTKVTKEMGLVRLFLQIKLHHSLLLP